MSDVLHEKTLPNEATTAFLLHNEIESNPYFQAFLNGLTSDERARFIEFGHHLLHIGFEEGMLLRDVEPTEAVMAKALIYQTTWFLKGAEVMAEEMER